MSGWDQVFMNKKVVPFTSAEKISHSNRKGIARRNAIVEMLGSGPAAAHWYCNDTRMSSKKSYRFQSRDID